MLNLYSIDERSGEVTGLFLGDGGFSILKKEGAVLHFKTGKYTSRLSTLKGQRGRTNNMKDIVGEKVVLEEGDMLLMYSDALQHPSVKIQSEGRMIIDDISDVVKLKESTQR